MTLFVALTNLLVGVRRIFDQILILAAKINQKKPLILKKVAPICRIVCIAKGP